MVLAGSLSELRFLGWEDDRMRIGVLEKAGSLYGLGRFVVLFGF